MTLILCNLMRTCVHPLESEGLTLPRTSAKATLVQLRILTHDNPHAFPDGQFLAHFRPKGCH